MNRLFLIISFLFSVAFAAVGQSILDIVVPEDKPKPISRTDSVPADDAVYAQLSVKKYGWHYPVQIVEKNDFKNYFGLIKFSKKDKAGHYTRVECIDGLGNPNPGVFSLSLQRINGIDSIKIADEDIATIMSRASVMEFISDSSGENLVKERISDSDGNLLFTTSLVHPDPNTILTTVFDRFGSPLKCGIDSFYNYPIYPIEQIVFDKWGYDSVVRFFDSKGAPLLNTDLAYLAITANDSLGNIIRRQSADLDGNLIIDIAENCGYSYEYDSNRNVIRAINRDNSWRPIPTKLGDKIGTTFQCYEYDNLNRQTRLYFVDSDGNPDTTIMGTHEIRYTYGPDMSTTLGEGFDLEGRPSPIYADGRSWVKESYKYENGKQVEYHIFDFDGKPYSDEDYYSSKFNAYDSNGNLVSEEGFVAEDGIERLYYKNYNAPDSAYTQWSDGSYRIKLLDKKGRTISNIDYISSGELNPTYTYPKIITKYIDKKKHCRIIEKYFDSNNNLDRIDLTDIDSIAYTKDIYKLNRDSVPYESYRLAYNPDFTLRLNQYNINRNGKPVKTVSSSEFSCDKATVRSGPSGNISAIFYNDFAGNPDFCQSSLDNYYHIIMYREYYNSVRFDTDNSVINYFEAKDTDRPQALTIEVTNPAAYAAGIKDDDIILQYGDYILDWNVRGSSSAHGYWALKSVLNADSEKEIIVYRPEKENEKASIRRISLPKGTPSELGFKAHVLNQTYPQVERINAAVATYNEQHPTDTITSPEFFHYPSSSTPFAYILPPRYRSQKPNNFDDQIGDPALITYVDNPGFIGYDCLSFNSLYNLINISNFSKNQAERYGEHYIKPDYIKFPTCFVTTGNNQLKSFTENNDSRFLYAFFPPSSTDSLRLLNLPVLKQNPEPYFGDFRLDADMPREQLDSLYFETYDAYMAGLNLFALNRMKEFARIDYTPALEILAYYYGFGYDVPIDYELSEKYARLAYEKGNNPAGFRPLIRHYIKLGEFEKAVPYLEIMANSPYSSLKKYALKSFFDEYFERNDTVNVFRYLNDYIALLDLNDADDKEELQSISQLYDEYDYPIMASGLLNLGVRFFEYIDIDKGLEYLSRCYDIDPQCVNDYFELSNSLYIAYHLVDNPENYPVFSKFNGQHHIIADVVDNPDYQASALGWSGEYYILKYGEWNPLSNFSIFEEKNKYVGEENPQTPYEVVLMDKKGRIVSHTFIGAIGVMLKVKSSSPKEVRKVRKAYNNWLKNHPIPSSTNS